MKIARFYYNAKYGLTFRKPKLALRIARSYLDIFLRRGMPLRYIDVCVNLACNLKCEHCFATAFKDHGTSAHTVPVDRRPALSVDEWHDVIHQCMDLGTIAIGITGGEPLLYSRLEELICASSPESMLIMVNTNGTLLTRERAEMMYKLGVDIVQISLDSGIEAEHDQFRKMTGVFQRAMEGMENAFAAGLKVTIVPTVSHFNIYSEGLRKLVQFTREKRMLLNLSIAAPVGNWNSHTECLLQPDEKDYLNQLVRTQPHVRRDFETNYWKQGCSAATEKLYITVFGDVIPCPYMHISFGNVRSSSVSEIRSRMLSVPELNGYHPICLVAEDHEFIKKYMSKITSEEVAPVHWTKVFSVEKK